MPEADPDTDPPAAIHRWSAIRDRQRLVPDIDAIFFESSNTKTFADDAERAAFRERWLGRYLVHHPQYVYLAMTSDGRVAGYLVGAIGEPSAFDDFAAANETFPAHLHVNLAPEFRRRGIGGELIDAFAADAARAGASGMHVVTSVDARNVRFYEREGFHPRARTLVNGHELVFLGRQLGGVAG